MKVYIASSPDIDIICVAKTYKAAVNYLFNCYWINPEDELMIDGRMTTLKEYFGEECADVMAEIWDEDMFNEFWDADFWICSCEVIE